MLLQAATELLQENFHGQSEMKLFVVEPVDSKRTPRFLIIHGTQRGDGGQQRNVCDKDRKRLSDEHDTTQRITDISLHYTGGLLCESK